MAQEKKQPAGEAVDRLYPARPLVGVGAVVFRGDAVLLVRRATPPRVGQWSLPGGLQEVGETAFAAARREVLEETGVYADILGLVDVVDAIDRDAGGRVRTHYTLVDVYGRWRSGEPCAASDAAEAAWMPLGAIGGLGMWPETGRIIRLARCLCF